jgi:hypothetical protein
METSKLTSVERDSVIGVPSRITSQGLSFALHLALCVGAWGFTMGVATLLHPDLDPPLVTLIPLGISFLFPLLFGLLANSVRRSQAAPLIWYAGIAWLLILGLWVLNLPTGPSACNQCGPPQKLWLTFFSLGQDSNLLDGQGRFLGTWPAAATFGYALGARLALSGKKTSFSNR